MTSSNSSTQIKEKVKETYTNLALNPGSCCWGDCGLPAGDALFQLLGYKQEDVASAPHEAVERFAGCGNPLAIDSLQPGEVVLDLGSGAGFDVFLAAKQVGDKGRVIGLDMTLEMIKNAERNREKLGLHNVEFRLGDIENMPIEDSSVNVIISNCVINLAPNKDRVFAEAYRVLKPGGRLMVSDIVSVGRLPEKRQRDLVAWVGCLAGALEEHDYLNRIRNAGFERVEVISQSLWGLVASDLIRAFKPADKTKF